MSRSLNNILLALAVAACPLAAGAAGVADQLAIDNSRISRADSRLHLYADIVLDQLRLGSNRQLFITPTVADGLGNSVVLPSVLVNGRAMHIAYERGALDGDALASHDVATEVGRKNGKPQTVDYHATTALLPWMWAEGAAVSWTVDSCGCGNLYGSAVGPTTPLALNPVRLMRVAYVTPAVTPLPVQVHQGKARVLFEVNRWELHSEPYTCRNGQRIDNRQQLSVIDDSIAYALSDRNVEIASIRVCGFASPEGTYLNNEKLSTNRSRALADYLAAKYSLPEGCAEYGAVAENWQGFREQVVAATDISADERQALLAVIDRPAYGPTDYDDKDRELRTGAATARLYRSRILPDWYPQLRVTHFEIATRLRPASDEQLAEIILTSPEKMTLNQMFRVAKLYPEGSADFNRVIGTALRYFPDDPTANLNAASAAIADGDYDRAEALLDRAGDGPEALNNRGVIACQRGDVATAAACFRAAAPLPEAAKNLALLEE